jgi:lipoprotein-anchoring transpeptidase ErfK/SrfK
MTMRKAIAAGLFIALLAVLALLSPLHAMTPRVSQVAVVPAANIIVGASRSMPHFAEAPGKLWKAHVTAGRSGRKWKRVPSASRKVTEPRWAPAPQLTHRVPPAAVFAAGNIVISTSERTLYYVEAPGKFRKFPIAVGRDGRKWKGVTSISRKVLEPRWAPPAHIRRANRKLPKIIEPGPRNPLGPAVLVLGNGTYGIHGTNKKKSIGTDASFGCFRMHNSDILVLFDMVQVGTEVIVLP